MKLMDTYTNVCFFTLIFYDKESVPTYMFFVSIASIGIILITKLILTLSINGYLCCKVKPALSISENSKILEFNQLMKKLSVFLLWLDFDNLSRLYDPDDSSESKT